VCAVPLLVAWRLYYVWAEYAERLGRGGWLCSVTGLEEGGEQAVAWPV